MSHNLLLPLVREYVRQHSITCDVLECDETLADTAAFCEHYGYSAEQSANTILVADRRDEHNVVACVLLADSRLDVNKKVCQLMATKRASFASAEQTRQVSGMEVGGVTAVGLPEAVPIYLDARVMLQSKVVMGGGNRTSKLLLDPHELTKLPNATVIEGLALARTQS